MPTKRKGATAAPSDAVKETFVGNAEELALGYLVGCLAVLETRMRALAEADRVTGEVRPAVEELLDEATTIARVVKDIGDTAEAGGSAIPLRRLAQSFDLLPFDLDLLLLAVAPDLDPKFERLYGQLLGDAARFRPSIGLALELSGRSTLDAEARDRLDRAGPLIDGLLISVEDMDRPFLSRTLTVPDRVISHLLGFDRPDPALAMALHPGPFVPCPADKEADRLGQALSLSAGPCYLREPPQGGGRAVAVAGATGGNRRLLVVDAERLPAGQGQWFARLAEREARLLGAVIVVGPVEAFSGPDRPGGVRDWADRSVPVVLHGQGPWEPAWSSRAPVVIPLPAPSAATRANLWRVALGPEVEFGGLDAEVARLRLGPERIRQAADGARLRADLDGGELRAEHVLMSVRDQAGGGLERLTRRIDPAVSWDDLVLAPGPLEALRDLAGRARHRDRVLEEWRLRPGAGRGVGIIALFAGDSGTGKTMSAEVVAGALGLPLYAVDLASVVDKYVGETEKNLERIFSEAEHVNAVLFFDEADALFGRRSEVREAHDRYANIEVSYLLQRMERFDGIAILASNLRSNLDEAFARRLDLVVDFPFPDADLRRRLWDVCLGPLLPRDDDLDLDFCAATFALAGGNIRSIVVSAAYRAAVDDRPVRMEDLMLAAAAELRKLGRMVLEADFGPWYDRMQTA